jgi:hypothetical protein
LTWSKYLVVRPLSRSVLCKKTFISPVRVLGFAAFLQE